MSKNTVSSTTENIVKEKNGTSSEGPWSGFTSESVQKILGQVITASSAVELLEKMKNKLLSQFGKALVSTKITKFHKES